MKNVRDLTLDQITEQLANTPRQELYRIIHDLATDEPQFSVAEAARKRGLKKETLLKLIKLGKLGPVHVPTERGDYRIPLSTLKDFDRRSAINTQAA